MSKMIRTNSNAQNNANISNERATGSGHQLITVLNSHVFEESFLPQSVRSDYLSAAEETEYEISVNTRRFIIRALVYLAVIVPSTNFRPCPQIHEA